MSGKNNTGLKLAKKLIEMNSSIIVYKMGEHGSITFTESGSIKTGVFPVNPLKPTGAGDAFMGGFINGMASGKSIEESVYQASACAAIVVTKVGCAPAMPNFKELNEFLKSNSIEKPDEVLKNAYSTI